MATQTRLLSATRKKISTTIAPESHAYFERLVKKGKARNLAEAVDLAIKRLRKYENRERLARATAEWIDNMSAEEIAEDRRLGEAAQQSLGEVDFNREP